MAKWGNTPDKMLAKGEAKPDNLEPTPELRSALSELRRFSDHYFNSPAFARMEQKRRRQESEMLEKTRQYFAIISK